MVKKAQMKSKKEDCKCLDVVTGLNNMDYFIKWYPNYIKENPNALLIFCDFTKFKEINDQFGHQEGDACLHSFGNILKAIFPDGEVTRKHGDEFLILTNCDKETLQERLKKCNELIASDKEKGIIPIEYKFNVGVVLADKDMEETIQKADIMMYEAKKRNSQYAYYDEIIYNNIINDKGFLKNTSQAIDEGKLPLASRNIYHTDLTPTDIIDVYTRDLENNKLFTEQRLKLLRDSGNIKKLDYLNLRKIILSSSITYDKKIIINIYANSMFSIVCPFAKFMATLVSVMNNNPEDFIICVNVSGFKENYRELVEQINLISNYGFEVALSGFELNECNPFLYVWAQVNIKYIKIGPTFWKTAKDNKKYFSLLNNSVQAFLENNMLPIFMKIETEEELAFIKSISEKILFEGNLVDKEKHITFK